MTRTSRLPGFNGQPWAERVAALQSFAGLSPEEVALLADADHLPLEQAQKVIENVIGRYALPFAVATNFVINGRDYLVPMCVEESSIVAAASYAAKLIRESGGFVCKSSEPLMIGQVQLLRVRDLEQAWRDVEANREQLVAVANAELGSLVDRGGGVRQVEARVLQEQGCPPMLVVHLLVDVRDAMGANLINSVAERMAPELEAITGGEARLRILSNLSDRRLARTEVRVKHEVLSSKNMDGIEVASRILEAHQFAVADPYRACTHNKGIMNGIDPVLVATGNDWRAVEAGAHAYAARSGRYRPMSEWSLDERGDLLGVLELPLAVGIVGGITRAHRMAQLALRILGIRSAQELAEVCVAAGLASNLAALKALATEGIQRGHMALHARNIAYAVGATPADVDRLVQTMISRGKISPSAAKEILAELQAHAGRRFPDPRPVNQYAVAKAILFGEHSVDCGEPALAVPVRDALITLLVEDNEYGEILIRSSTGDFDDRVPVEITRTVLKELGLPPDTGLTITGHTSIPVHAHLGSSAAFAVAITRATAQKFGLDLPPEQLNAIAFEAEKITHGTPSGIDNTVVTYERPVWYSNSGQFEFLPVGQRFELCLAYTGEAVPTKKVNQEWAEAMREQPELFQAAIRHLGEIARQGKEALVAGRLEKLGQLLTSSHRLFQALGFSTASLDRLVEAALAAGALGAKLTGEGRGGCIICLPPPGTKHEILEALRAAGATAVFSTEIR
jgi:hydroxymethylglutaryl-CoA reductase